MGSRLSRLLARGRSYLFPDRETERRRRGIRSSVPDAGSRRSLVGGARVVYRSNLFNSKINDFEQFKDGPKIVNNVIFLTVMRSGFVHQSKLRAPSPLFSVVFCLRGR